MEEDIGSWKSFFTHFNDGGEYEIAYFTYSDANPQPIPFNPSSRERLPTTPGDRAVISTTVGWTKISSSDDVFSLKIKLLSSGRTPSFGDEWILQRILNNVSVATVIVVRRSR